MKRTKTEAQLKKILRQAIFDVGSQGAFAEIHNLTRATVNASVNRDMSPRVAKALGYEPVKAETKYRRIK